MRLLSRASADRVKCARTSDPTLTAVAYRQSENERSLYGLLQLQAGRAEQDVRAVDQGVDEAVWAALEQAHEMVVRRCHDDRVLQLCVSRNNGQALSAPHECPKNAGFANGASARIPHWCSQDSIAPRAVRSSSEAVRLGGRSRHSTKKIAQQVWPFFCLEIPSCRWLGRWHGECTLSIKAMPHLESRIARRPELADTQPDMRALTQPPPKPALRRLKEAAPPFLLGAGFGAGVALTIAALSAKRRPSFTLFPVPKSSLARNLAKVALLAVGRAVLRRALERAVEKAATAPA
jgi:hypothetical protein